MMLTAMCLHYQAAIIVTQAPGPKDACLPGAVAGLEGLLEVLEVPAECLLMQ